MNPHLLYLSRLTHHATEVVIDCVLTGRAYFYSYEYEPLTRNAQTFADEKSLKRITYHRHNIKKE